MFHRLPFPLFPGLLGLAFALTPTAASAQLPLFPDAAGEKTEPPSLVERGEPVYPEAARAERLEAVVVLRLTIDVTGTVTDAEVVANVGYGFDEAARNAALRSRFTPAKRGGRPVASRVVHRIDFALPADAEDPPAVPESPPPPVPLPGEAPAPLEVMVLGKQSEGQRLQQSAEAVNVVDTRRAQQQSADMGEVLARTQGVAVRRYGGLGSGERFSLNGLYDKQVRFFFDGVPLASAGYSFGAANLPVNLVNRVEVYRGVVPVRFGADALGGAVNFVGDSSYEARLAASYQVGSFGTHRVTVDARGKHEPSGLVFSAAAFFDRAKNDYEVDVEIPDAQGQLSSARVRRFHDGYRAYGATVEGGFVERPWAKRLLLRAFASTYDKELQHNLVMTVPYGEVSYGETVYGSTARYDVALPANLELGLIVNYARRRVDFADKSEWIYGWRGERISGRRVAGEIEADPTDQSTWEHSGFGRALLEWTPAPSQALRAALTPVYTTRTGDERLQADPAARDPLTAKRKLFTLVSGLEYELNLFEQRLAAVVFVKDYFYSAQSEEPLAGGVFRDRETKSHTWGRGGSARLRFTPWLYAKASYEYATRLPQADEVFGDGSLVLANLGLEPEVSHNANAGPRVELRSTPWGDLTVDVNAFLRHSRGLIVLLGNDRFFSYRNVYTARGLGLESGADWRSPGRLLALEGTLTWQDIRNASGAGTFGDFEGDRIPNRPYLFASWGARLRFTHLPGAADVLEPFYRGRYVHEFFRGWESQGLREFKQVVDAQVTHAVGISWTLSRDSARGTATMEVDNVTGARVFDNFGVQRPGRAIYLKLSGEIG